MEVGQRHNSEVSENTVFNYQKSLKTFLLFEIKHENQIANIKISFGGHFGNLRQQ